MIEQKDMQSDLIEICMIQPFKIYPKSIKQGEVLVTNYDYMTSDNIDYLLKNTPDYIIGKKGLIESIKQYFVDDILKICDDPKWLLDYMIENKFKNKPDKMIGITGTNGKTSIAMYVCDILTKSGFDALAITTVGSYLGGMKIKDFSMTTPSAPCLHSIIDNVARKTDKLIAITEVSSHAILQGRVSAIQYDIAAISYIGEDHIEYHSSIENYVATKKKLFDNFLKPDGTRVINMDCRFYNEFAKKKFDQKVITYSIKKDKDADIYLDSCKINANGAVFVVICYGKKYYFDLKLNSFWQIANFLSAIGILVAMGMESILNTIQNICVVKGRMEQIKKKGKPTVFIDYAHSPCALKSVLLSCKIMNGGSNIIVVLGCGGGRDILKRAKMGKIANYLADKVYITDDNPRMEDPKIIRKQIKQYCKKGIEIEDRKKAIKTAICNANANDIVVIAGKGHEKTQEIGGVIKKHDDYETANRYLEYDFQKNV